MNHKIAAIVKTIMLLGAFAGLQGQSLPPKPAVVKLWRLDCGRLTFADFESFSDTHRYDAKPYSLVASCYLVRHENAYMLWDAGLQSSLIGKTRRMGPFDESLDNSIVAQLARIGITPAMIRYVGISHYHADHTGQAKDFANATLLVGAKDWAAVRSRSPDAMPIDGLLPWLKRGAKVDAVEGDRDVFGDGSVTMLSMPGHTPGHHSLLIRLRTSGWILLSGDQFHAAESYQYDQVPRFNYDRAQTMASTARFKEIVANLGAHVIIQHEPADVAKLPAFPDAAE